MAAGDTDAGASMAIYTFATVAFYLLGRGGAPSSGLTPGSQLIRTLRNVRAGVRLWAKWLFVQRWPSSTDVFVANVAIPALPDAVRVFASERT